MLEVIEFVITKFTGDVIVIASAVSVVLAIVIIAFWLYNRRRFHRLGHQIPASVVKNYLDSIIQNSTALKSSLFRGGGLDVGTGVPSVVPVQDIGTGAVTSSGPSHEELNQKIAEISSLQSRLTEKERVISDLERKAGDLERQLSGSAGGDELVRLQKEIDDLKEKLRQAEQNTGGGGDTAELERQLAEVTKERDQLKERLMEYEIIEEDLANLKRLQQENEQLKKSLAALQGGAPAAEEPAAEEPAAEEPAAEEPAAEEPAAEEPAAEEPAAEEPAAEVPENAGEQKSAEELLGEFEKMLG